jgi:hypothetical protein
MVHALLLGFEGDSSLVKGVPADEQGQYVFTEVKTGRYRVSATHLGYTPVQSAVFEVASGATQVPALYLAEATQVMGGVEVTAQKPLFEQQLDRMVVNVASSVTAAGAMALDILERSPGIIINRQNNTLAMLRKNGVMVMIKGKPSRLPLEAVMQLLAGMNAGNVEKIELITAPPAQYDAEGTA